MSSVEFIVNRADLRETRVVQGPSDTALPDGAVRLRIDSFALTSNNITYGAFGDAMHYWDFFPCPVEGFGRIPVWGFADVEASNVEGIAVGERFYGYYPMSSHVVLFPEQVGKGGFVDGAPNRRELHALYNRYMRNSTDAGLAPEHEAQTALLRPLFTTSFLIDDFLSDNDFFGAKAVILSSASSKTAYGTAFCLRQRVGISGEVKIIGLTSVSNLEFTRGLGCYDEVLTYDAIASLPPDTPSVYVDMSGSASVRSDVHHHFGDALRHSCSVGGTHWTELGGGKGLPGPRPTLFFAPAQAAKRMKDWGPGELPRRIAVAWDAFMKPVTSAETPWLKVVRGRGPADVEAVYRDLIDGRTDPRQGHILSL
jgi:hypothetical protein